VQIKAGSTQHIAFNCDVFALDGAPTFTALSYTWGDEERTQQIELQGKSLLITKNLESFLLEAKRRMEVSAGDSLDKQGWNGGWLWIDSMCINQSDVKEKSVQVAMMKDIYESAQTVISWLGEMDEDSELGMEYILDFDYFREKRSSSSPKKFSQDAMPFDVWCIQRDRWLKSIQYLISRSYWRRIWVVQEATTPKQPYHSLVWCGAYTDSFETFMKTAEFLTRVSMVDDLPGMLHDASTDALRSLISLRILRKESPSLMDLQYLLPYVQRFDSTDPRDKIFGLLSMASSNITSLAADYAAEADDIYTDLACQLIEKGWTLDVLGFCGVSGDFDLPSWVPDWTATGRPTPFLRHTLNTSGSLERLYHATDDTTFDGFIDKEEGTLYASGFEFDALEWTSVPRYFNSGQDNDIAHHWAVSALGMWSKYITGCTRQEALAHVLCADVKEFTQDPRRYSLLGKRPSFIPLPEHDDHLGIFAYPDPKIRDATMQRLLFFTGKGYMGLAPFTAQVGDKVCLLEGAQFPIILRPNGDSWVVVGESYSHGIMDGEGWDEMMSEGDSGLESFEIR
jgi:Heterokaryon incompatibility protein (HET)